MTPPTYRFNVGAFECVAFQTGEKRFEFDHGYGKATAEQVVAAIRAEGLDPSDHPFSLNLLSVKTPEHRILIDAGGGQSDFAPGMRDLKYDLYDLDIKPDEIDYVVITHAHWDHFAGILDSDSNITLPNAEYFMWKGEWDYCTSPEQLALTEEDNPKFTKQVLLPLREHIHLIEDEGEILPGISVMTAPGHSRGQIAVVVTSNGEGVINVADAIHFPFLVENPDWVSSYDPLPEATSLTRLKLLERATRENLLIFGFHFPFPGLGYVKQDESGFHWQPVAQE